MAGAPGLLEILTLSAGQNTTVVTLGAACLGLAAGMAGSFVYLRRQALISDALGHATLPGIALAWLIGAAFGVERSLPLLLAGAAVTGVLGVLTVSWLVERTRLTEDAAIGVSLSVWYGLGVVLLSVVQTVPAAGRAGLSHFILGQTAAMQAHEAQLVALVALAAAGTVALLFRPFRALAFDPDFVVSLGWPARHIGLLITALATLVMVIGLQTVGLVLILALLIIPPVTARLWTDRVGRLVPLAAALGAIAGFVGAAASALLPDLPAGGIIVLTAGALFTFSLVASPQRGLIAAALARLRRPTAEGGQPA